MFGDFKQHMGERAARRSGKRHTGFFGSAVAFFNIALETGRHDIVPGIHAATGAGDDVVYGQIVPFVTAVLADVIVPVQDIAPGETDLFVGDFDVGAQPDNGGQRRIHIDATPVVFDRLGFALHQKDHGPSPRADIKWLIASVEYQYF